MTNKLRKRKNLNYKKIVFVIVAFISLTFVSLGYSYFKTTLGFDSTATTGDVINNCYYVEILGKKMYTCPDNKKSKYVTSDTGIDYTKNASETNGRGLYTLTSTINDTYPIYYYRGNAYDNNVIFANKCWKIVRTTETGGTKLIYNGLPQDGKCDVLGVDKSIGSSRFNANETHTQPSPGYVGYMYSSSTSNYTSKHKGFSSFSSDIGNHKYLSSSEEKNNYFFSKNYTYSGGKYSLTNPVQLGNFKDIKSTLKGSGYYTCWLTTTDSCSKLFYVSNVSNSYVTGIELSNGNNLDYYNNVLRISSGIKDNDNGTYSLNGNIENINITKFLENYNNYKNNYYCSDFSSTTCSKAYYISSFNEASSTIWSVEVANLVFGNDVVWNGSNYVLQDTYAKSENISFDTAIDNISTRHYTCYTSGTVCSEVYYNVESDTNSFDYITLKNGKRIEDAMNDMFSSSNDLRNETDSTMKTFIDTWYEANMTEYENYLEDTIWCNDRTISTLNSYDKDLTNLYKSGGAWIRFGNGKNVEESIKGVDACPNTLDRFTVNSSNGNGKLKYKIGLLTMQEGKLYNNDESSSITMTPYGIYSNPHFSNMYTISGGKDYSRSVSPSISLKQGVTITSGDGTSENPYIIN